MLYIDGLTELASRYSKTITDADFKNLAKKKLNLGYREVAKSWDWSSLKRYGSLIAVPNVTGTATVTTDSYSVSIAGITLTTDFLGRYFQLTGKNNVYRIVNCDISAGTIVLDQPITESSGSYACEITKRFYRLPTEVRKVIGFSGGTGKRTINPVHSGIGDYDERYENPFQDQPFDIFGSDIFVSYTVGSTTIVATADNREITGVGTSWLSLVQPGNIITFGNNNYRVAYVKSDTSLVLINNVIGNYNGTYKFSYDISKMVELRISATERSVIPYRYIKSVYELVNENYDRTELDGEEDQCIFC